MNNKKSSGLCDTFFFLLWTHKCTWRNPCLCSFLSRLSQTRGLNTRLDPTFPFSSVFRVSHLFVATHLKVFSRTLRPFFCFYQLLKIDRLNRGPSKKNRKKAYLEKVISAEHEVHRNVSPLRRFVKRAEQRRHHRDQTLFFMWAFVCQSSSSMSSYDLMLA